MPSYSSPLQLLQHYTTPYHTTIQQLSTDIIWTDQELISTKELIFMEPDNFEGARAVMNTGLVVVSIVEAEVPNQVIHSTFINFLSYEILPNICTSMLQKQPIVFNPPYPVNNLRTYSSRNS